MQNLVLHVLSTSAGFEIILGVVGPVAVQVAPLHPLWAPPVECFADKMVQVDASKAPGAVD
jgi:hypothetical protein